MYTRPLKQAGQTPDVIVGVPIGALSSGHSFTPIGDCPVIATDGNSLFVSDAVYLAVHVWKELPQQDYQAPDVFLGSQEPWSENLYPQPTSSIFNTLPGRIAFDGHYLVVSELALSHSYPKSALVWDLGDDRLANLSNATMPVGTFGPPGLENAVPPDYSVDLERLFHFMGGVALHNSALYAVDNQAGTEKRILIWDSVADAISYKRASRVIPFLEDLRCANAVAEYNGALHVDGNFIYIGLGSALAILPH